MLTHLFKGIAAVLTSALVISCAPTETPGGDAETPSSHSTLYRIKAHTASLPDAGPMQVPIPTTAAEVAGPVPGNTMTKEYVQMAGRSAYLWGCHGQLPQPARGVLRGT